MATAGYTHLIEHLALSTLGDPSPHQNGFVTGAATGFFTMGRRADVANLLASACDVLTSLPGDRLEGEKQVLASEIAARPFDSRSDLTQAFAEVFRALGEVEESEVEAARRQIRDRWTGALAPQPADRMVFEAQSAASASIFGGEFESLEKLATELSSVTADDVLAFGREMEATTMFALPTTVKVPPSFGRRAPLSTVSVVQGRETLSVDAPIVTQRLVHGPDGVSVLRPDGLHWTVRYAELAGAVYYEDGCVCLIGLDATSWFVGLVILVVAILAAAGSPWSLHCWPSVGCAAGRSAIHPAQRQSRPGKRSSGCGPPRPLRLPFLLSRPTICCETPGRCSADSGHRDE